MSDGIKVQCVYNSTHTKTLTFAEARQGVPLCEHDGGPMIAVQATLTTKKLQKRKR